MHYLYESEEFFSTGFCNMAQSTQFFSSFSSTFFWLVDRAKALTHDSRPTNDPFEDSPRSFQLELFDKSHIEKVPGLGVSRVRKLFEYLHKSLEDGVSKYSEWKKVAREFAQIDEKTLWGLRPVKFCLDIRREIILINTMVYKSGLINELGQPDRLLDGHIVTLLNLYCFPSSNPSSEYRQRKIHTLRYQIQDVMHQWIYNIDTEFTEKYNRLYINNGRMLIGINLDIQMLDQSGKESPIALTINADLIKIIAIQYWKVVNPSKNYETEGYDGQKVVISIAQKDLDQNELLLSRQHSPDVDVVFSGMFKELKDVPF
jgi:hypothetical protein